MKKVILLSIVSIFLLPMCSSSKKMKRSNEQIKIAIEQHGKVIQPSNGTVTLEKEAFNFIITFPKPLEVLVNASFHDKLLKLTAQGEPMVTRDEFRPFNFIAIEIENPKEILYLSDDSSSPWVYERAQEHNFNNVEIKKGKYQCTRTISTVQDIDTDDFFNIEEIEQPVYLVFARYTRGKQITDNITIDLPYLKIEWKK